MAKVVALESGASSAELDRPGQLTGVRRPSIDTFARAQLDVFELTKDHTLGARVDTIRLQFNPTQVTVNKGASWTNTRTGKKGAVTQYAAWQAATLGFTVFLDATSSSGGSVVAAVERLQACCLPTDKSVSDNRPSPPLVVLRWGTVTSFPAYVTSANASYVLFAASGLPLRATCVLSLTEMWLKPARQNPTSGSEAVRRVHRTVAGDTLATVAYAEYGDPACWRPLAAWNGIDDPLRVPVGTLLEVPEAQQLLAAGSAAS